LFNCKPKIGKIQYDFKNRGQSRKTGQGKLSTKKKKHQILISTHSPDLLSDEGIGAEEILILKPGKEGTLIFPSDSVENFRWLMNKGMNLSDIVVSQTRPKDLEQLSLFK
jgi:hypothetical protein